jgi:hypothetical protein
MVPHGTPRRFRARVFPERKSNLQASLLGSLSVGTIDYQYYQVDSAIMQRTKRTGAVMLSMTDLETKTLIFAAASRRCRPVATAALLICTW